MKKFLVILLAAIFVLPQSFSVAADKPCSKSLVGQAKSGSVCTKVGSLYRWKALPKPVATPTPTPTATPTPTPTATPTTIKTVYTPPSVVSDSVELCKIKELSQRRWFTVAGFPEISQEYLQSIAKPVNKSGTVKWALIPVDFADLPGDAGWRLRLEKETKLLSDWVEVVSEGKFKVEWVIANDWVRLPGVSSDYPVAKVRGLNNTPGGLKLFKTAMATADPTFDFTNVQTVNFMLPTNQTIAKEGENGFPWDEHVKELVTNEGRISSFTISGQYQTKSETPLWAYWFHEFGHAIALPHVGAGGPEVPPFNEWDIMGSQDGASLELSGWLRMLARWMPDERVYCKDYKSITKVELDLVPLSNKDSGIKLAIFPLSDTKALLVESRRVTRFSCTTPTPRNGVLVYVLDLTLGHGQDFLVPVNPLNRTASERSSCNGFPSQNSLDILLHEGDTVSYGGLTVEFLKYGNYDKIIISKP
jgi:M6 family metalloprotease-like protein